MADELKKKYAEQAFSTLCAALNARNWNYEVEEDNLLVHFGVSGDDIPMKFIIFVDVDRQMIRLLSPLSFKMSEEKRVEGAIATCAASYGMADGSFDYDISDGSISFRMTESFRNCSLGEGVIQYLISCACAMVDQYNDRFYDLARGKMTIKEFSDLES